MALSPEDVIKKSFNATHLRRGYDETQVDDFLDEVVVELRRLHAENDDLSTQLADCRASKGYAEGEVVAASAGGAAASIPDLSEDELVALREEKASLEQELEELRAEVESARTEAEEGDAETRARLEGELAELQERVDTARAEAEQAEAEANAAREAAARADAELAAARDTEGEVAAFAAGMGPYGEDNERAIQGGDGPPVDDPTSIITLAQRLHDDHVREGETTKQRLVGEGDDYRNRVVSEADAKAKELVEDGQRTHDELVTTGQQKHDELVSTGQARHDELVSTGQQRHDTLISEAKTERSTVLADLETKKTAVTAKIEELTAFESDYRGRMRSFIGEQLHILDRDGDGIPDNAQ